MPSASAAPEAELPVRDLLDLARRFDGYAGPELARDTPFDYQIGDQEQFTLIDLNKIDPYAVTASLVAITEHAYFFVQDDSEYAGAPIDEITADFENIVWPTVTEAFGEPWTPGIDSDPRITVLNAQLAGAGGYVTSLDEYPREALEFSNGREMLYIEVSALGTPGPSYNALIAHELQHLVHFNADQNEESWVNEGLSQVAWEMAGGGSGGVFEFLDRPDTQLNFWDPDDTSVHYSESELFFAYLLDHYGGRENAKAMLDMQPNSIAGVEEYLADFDVTFEEVFADFVAANLLDLDSGPYSHGDVEARTEDIYEPIRRDDEDLVSQFGTDYIRFSGDNGEVFRFDGSDEVTIGIPNESGAFWWSNRSDSIDTKLTREIDLSGVDGATLTFDTWYDIEEGWDYGYVAVSEDGGATWVTLPGQRTTDSDPVGAAYGPGYTGQTNGWRVETVDLGDYAGEVILLRFEYIADDATNLTGFAVDNIAIPEIDFRDPVEEMNGWEAEGFTLVPGPTAQRFIVQVISADGTVEHVELSADNAADIPLDGDEVTIAISGSTRNTTERASYEWSVARMSV